MRDKKTGNPSPQELDNVFVYPFLQTHVEGEYRLYHKIPRREMAEIPYLAGVAGLRGKSLQYLWFEEQHAGVLMASHLTEGDDGRPAVRVFGAVLPRRSVRKLMRCPAAIDDAMDYLDQLLTDASQVGPTMIPIRTVMPDQSSTVRESVVEQAKRAVLNTFAGDEQHIYAGDLSAEEVLTVLQRLPPPVRIETSVCLLHCRGCRDDKLLIAAVKSESDLTPLPKTVRITESSPPLRCPAEEQLDRLGETQIRELEESSSSAREFVSRVLSTRSRCSPPDQPGPVQSGGEKQTERHSELPFGVRVLLAIALVLNLATLLIPRVDVVTGARQICLSITISGIQGIAEGAALLAAGLCMGMLIGRRR